MADVEPSIPRIRPALELAWAVARIRSQARPPQQIPGRMRPLMRVAKLPDRMLATIKQVLEDDSEFREQVVELAEEERLGRMPWLWLTRPEGWEAELGSLIDESAERDARIAVEKDAALAQQRISSLEADLARVQAEVAALKEVNVGLGAQAEEDRKARRRAVDDLRTAQAELVGSEQRRERLQADVSDLQLRVDQLTSNLESQGRREASFADELGAARSDAERLAGELQTSRQQLEAMRVQSEQDREAASIALATAAGAALELGDALSDARRVIGGQPAGEGPVFAPAAEARHDVSHAGRSPAESAGRPRRAPVRLPPAVFDDSAEAAEHLVRTPGILLVVDGYNVTLSAWSELSLPDQRRRLVDALAELVTRVGASVQLYFDGVEDGSRLHPPAAARRGMRVEFSPSSREADELIVALVDRLDALQPVVVATDDRRVRDEVRRRGANVISVAQLLSALGRVPVTPP